MNSDRLPTDDLLVDDLVLFKNRQKEDKFDNKWIGPFTITEIKENDTYLIRSLETGITFRVVRSEIKYFNFYDGFNSSLGINKSESEGMLPNSATLTFKIFK